MRLEDLRILPKVRNSGSFLYLEHGRLEQDDYSVRFVDRMGRTPIPVANLSLLLLGPGTTVTHRAIVNAAECGSTVAWSGESGVRMYAAGLGDSRSARHLLKQAVFVTEPDLRMKVVRAMYEYRFAEALSPDLTLRQIRGKEGARVRDTYRSWSEATGVPWEGRRFARGDWDQASPINRALSAATSSLYGICHAAIVSVGYSPGLGFVHSGKALSFVYDVADLYKTVVAIPAAFRAVQSGVENVESAARLQLRDRFHETRILGHIVDDIGDFFELEDGPLADRTDASLTSDLSRPGALWDPGAMWRAGSITETRTTRFVCKMELDGRKRFGTDGDRGRTRSTGTARGFVAMVVATTGRAICGRCQSRGQSDALEAGLRISWRRGLPDGYCSSE